MVQSFTAARRPDLFRYVLVTAARNEAEFIELTIRSVVAQTIRPVKWLIVSDGSTDATDEIVAKWAADHPWMSGQMLERVNDVRRAATAFNLARERMKDLGYVRSAISPTRHSAPMLRICSTVRPRWIAGCGGHGLRGPVLRYDYCYVSIEHAGSASVPPRVHGRSAGTPFGRAASITSR